MTRSQQGVVLLLILLLSLLFFFTFSPPPSNLGDSLTGPRPIFSAPAASEEVWVEVEGDVQTRGVWSLPKGQTVREVLEKTGGVQGSLSLPADSMNARMEKSLRLNVVAAREGRGDVLFQPLDPPKMKILSIPVNINKAKAEELKILPGVGPMTAQAIIDYRERNGKFSALEDLLKVKGIGPKKFDSLRSHITIQD